MEYKVIRSRRKTAGIEIRDGFPIVRVPAGMTDAEIAGLVKKHEKWIEKHMKAAEKQRREFEKLKPITDEELEKLADKACRYIPQRVAYYAPKVGVTYGRITIRNQRTKWGSCSSKGNLNFNCLLMLMPPEVIDSVVVHELCHRKQMNHSEKFYAEVLRVYPEYRKWNGWLKKNGAMIMKRMTMNRT